MEPTAAWPDITAGQVMTAPAVTVPPDTPVGSVAELLTSRRISAVPVVDRAGSVLGLVSERDLLARTGRTAAEIMSTDVISVTTDTDIERVRHLLVDQPIRRVPVLSAGHVVGIISRHDLLGLLLTEWVCRVCGESVRGENTPPGCPKCGGSADRFSLQEQPPGP
jgi:CBS-domain-containing membrane protein